MKNKITTELHLVVDSTGDLNVTVKGDSIELEAAFMSLMIDDDRMFDVMRSAMLRVIARQITERIEEKDEVEEQMEGVLSNNVWSQVVGEA